MKNAQGKVDILKEINASWLVDVAVIVLITWLLSAASQRIFPWIADRVPKRLRFATLAAAPLLRLILLGAAASLLLMRTFDLTKGNLVTILSVSGVALGFAFKDYVSSILAGIVTLYERPYRLGDWLSVNGAYGEVKEINMRAVTIVTPDDNAVVIPHLKMWDTLYHNSNDGTPFLMCVSEFFLAPGHDGELVRNTLYDVALTSPWLQFQKPITVVAFDHPWGTKYKLKGYPVDPRDQFQFMTDLTLRGNDALQALGARFVEVPLAVTKKS